MRRVQQQRTSIAELAPLAAELLQGELFVNLADGVIYTKTLANAVIRLNNRIYVRNDPPANPADGDAYIDQVSGHLLVFYATIWNTISPDQDLSGLLSKAGGIMLGQVTLPGGGGANDAVTLSEATALGVAGATSKLDKAGGVMSGQITLPGGAVGAEAVNVTQMNAAILAASGADLSLYLLKAGGVMSGHITLPGGGANNQAVTVLEVAASIAAHSAQPDPHGIYALDTDLAAHVGTGGAAHANASITVAGFMTAADKVVLNGIPAALALKSDKGIVDGLRAVTASGNFILADAGAIIEASDLQTIVLRIPPQTDVAWADRTRFDLVRRNTGAVRIAPGAGVTLNSAGNLRAIGARYGSISLYRRALNDWTAVGNLSTSGPSVASYIGKYSDVTDLTVYTSTAYTFTGKYVVAAFHNNGAALRTGVSAVVNGVAMTLVAGATNGFIRTEIWISNTPVTGTGTVAITWSGVCLNGAMSVYEVSNLVDPLAYATIGDTVVPLSPTLAVPLEGCVIAAGFSAANTTATWVGATEQDDTAVGAAVAYSSAMFNAAAAEVAHAVTLTWGVATTPTLLVVSFGG